MNTLLIIFASAVFIMIAASLCLRWLKKRERALMSTPISAGKYGDIISLMHKIGRWANLCTNTILACTTLMLILMIIIVTVAVVTT